MNHEKIISLDGLKKYWFDSYENVLFTNGCFDLFHAGHAKALNDIKKDSQSNCFLIVGVNSDKSIKKIKGESRPIINQNERAYVVACHRAVDMVFIFDEENVSSYIKMIRPNFWYKSSDYDIKSINQEERLSIEEVNGEIKFINLVDGISTSKIINKIGGIFIE
jgi:rfaE bifunctional protein nucleotidyltransferase chain/domain